MHSLDFDDISYLCIYTFVPPFELDIKGDISKTLLSKVSDQCSCLTKIESVFIPYFSWNAFNVFQKFHVARLRFFADI